MHFSNQVINWYQHNKRDLPWRNSSNPYEIWISEIILQQTRVNQGLFYYERFIRRFPDIASLSEADEDEVLKYWQGLGYYQRARNLHATARQIVSLYKGVFPSDYHTVLSLKGVGEYTAAAICSFAYNQPYAVVDGNVFRLLSRMFGIQIPIDSGEGKKKFAELAQTLLDVNQPAVYNQAVMELGAMVCTPFSPACMECPLQEGCYAFANRSWADFPVKRQKTKQHNRYFYYFYITGKNGKIFLHKREKKDIWQNLYELPLIETDGILPDGVLQQEIAGRLTELGFTNVLIKKTYPVIKHLLSHRNIHASFWEIEADYNRNGTEFFLEIEPAEIENYAISRLTDIFFSEMRGCVQKSLFEHR